MQYANFNSKKNISSNTQMNSKKNSSNTLWIPPVNFALVEDGIYRSAYPEEANIPFLAAIGIKTIALLSIETLSYSVRKAIHKARLNHSAKTSDGIGTINDRRIRILEISDMSNWERDDMNSGDDFSQYGVLRAIDLAIDTRWHPLLLTCPTGELQTNVVVGCMRRYQYWSLSAIYNECELFSKVARNIRTSIMTFIASWNPESFPINACDIVHRHLHLYIHRSNAQDKIQSQNFTYATCDESNITEQAYNVPLLPPSKSETPQWKMKETKNIIETIKNSEDNETCINNSMSGTNNNVVICNVGDTSNNCGDSSRSSSKGTADNKEHDLTESSSIVSNENNSRNWKHVVVKDNQNNKINPTTSLSSTTTVETKKECSGVVNTKKFTVNSNSASNMNNARITEQVPPIPEELQHELIRGSAECYSNNTCDTSNSEKVVQVMVVVVNTANSHHVIHIHLADWFVNAQRYAEQRVRNEIIYSNNEAVIREIISYVESIRDKQEYSSEEQGREKEAHYHGAHGSNKTNKIDSLEQNVKHLLPFIRYAGVRNPPAIDNRSSFTKESLVEEDDD